MPNVLCNVVSFANLAVGVPTALPHGLSLDNYGLIPDFVAFDQPNITYLAATATTITIQNDGAAPVTVNAWCERKHTIPRALPPPLLNLTPQPFVIASGGGAGDNEQTFRRAISQPADGSDFVVLLPAARANDSYIVLVSMVDVVSHVTFAMPDTLPGDRTTTQFRVITSAAMIDGDVLEFRVSDR